MDDRDALTSSDGSRSVDLLVRHAYVITMDDDRRLIDDGAIAIAGRRIVDVGDDADLAARHDPDRTIDARGAPVHPGLVECHLHASYQTYRGVVPDHIREDEVFDAIERAFYNTVTDEEEHLGCLLAAMEMIRNGTTCFMEAGTVLEPSAVAEAAQLVGIRALIGDAFIWDRPTGLAQGKETPDDGPVRVRGMIGRVPRNLDEALARLGHELRRNADPDALVTGHVAVLGLGTASEELLLEAKRQADAAGVVLNMHHAYSPADTAADRVRYGKDPLIHLAEIGILDRNVTLGHANHLTDAECEVLLERDVSIAWAPAASMMWAHGGSFHGRHAELWRRGGNISLGSDSANWSNSFDLFRQANLAMLDRARGAPGPDLPRGRGRAGDGDPGRGAGDRDGRPDRLDRARQAGRPGHPHTRPARDHAGHRPDPEPHVLVGVEVDPQRHRGRPRGAGGRTLHHP